MYLVAIAWIYVALMMSVAEALHPTGTLLGAAFTFLLYGVLPLSIVLYLLGTPMRRRNRLQTEAAEAAAMAATTEASADHPDQRGHAPAAPLAPERKEL